MADPEATSTKGENGKGDTVRPSPTSAGETLARDAEAGGGPFTEPPEYIGSIGRTTFDDHSSADGTITVVLPPDNIDRVPSQSLLKILSMPDKREYIATVTEGPFCEPDGMRADAPALIASAVHGAMAMPRHHGRVQASVIGLRLGEGLTPARHRPKPNSPVHRVPDSEMAGILNLTGDIRLGLAYGHDSVEVCIPSKMKSVLPRHTAAVGTTGGGKSTGIGRFVAGLQGAGNCVVLLDVEGEYTQLNEPTDNAQLVAALEDRGLKAHGIPNTHVFHLVGRDCSNPNHPSRTAFSLRFQQISPYAFAEIMDLSQAQEDRVLKAYEIAKLLMRQLDIFPRKGQYEKQDNDKVLEIDEFDRGWPMMTLEHLSYVIGGVINLAEGKADEEPQMRARGFQGKWQVIRGVILGQFGGSGGLDDDDDEGGGKRKGSRGPKFGDMRSWKVLSSRITRIRKLGVFDRDANEGTPLQYQLLLQPGRVLRDPLVCFLHGESMPIEVG